jgi:hypothetical protein
MGDIDFIRRWLDSVLLGPDAARRIFKHVGSMTARRRGDFLITGRRFFLSGGSRHRRRHRASTP